MHLPLRCEINCFLGFVLQIRLKKKFEGEANELELVLEGANRVRKFRHIETNVLVK